MVSCTLICALLGAGRESGLTPCLSPLTLSHPSHKKHPQPSPQGIRLSLHLGLCQRLGGLCHTALRLSGARGSSCCGVVLSVKKRHRGGSREEERGDCVLALWGLGADSVLSQAEPLPSAFHKADPRKDLGDHGDQRKDLNKNKTPLFLSCSLRKSGSWVQGYLVTN